MKDWSHLIFYCLKNGWSNFELIEVMLSKMRADFLLFWRINCIFRLSALTVWCSLLMAYQGVFTCCCPSCQRHIHCPSSQVWVDRKVSQWASLTSSLLTHDKHHGKNMGAFYSPEMYRDSDTKLGTVVSIWLLLPMVSRILLAVFQGKENHLLQTRNSN